MNKNGVRSDFVILLFMTGFLVAVGTQFNVYHYAVSVAHLHIGLADINSFSGALQWVKSAGYFLMFIAMIIEGPIITSAAAFAAALGYFNIFIILILSILGDLTGDFVYYGMGYFGRVTVVEKYGHKVGLTKERMERMEKLIKEHPTKTMTAIKLAPVIPGPGLMMIGATKMPFWKYAWITLVVTLPKTILFMLLGYYFGRAYDTIAHYLQNGEYFILVALVLIVIVYYGYKKLSERISARLETV